MITCKITNMCYIGQTTQTITKRFGQHLNKKSSCRGLCDAVNEHGKENFYIKTVWEGDVNELDANERHFIYKYNTIHPNGYNLKQGGGRRIDKVSESTIELMVFKQREQTIKKFGKLGYILENKSKVDGRTTSWSVRARFRGANRLISRCYSKEEALKVQEEYTRDPDSFEIPKSTRKANGNGGIYFNAKRNKKWMAYKDKKYIGRYYSEIDARNALESYIINL